MTESPQAVDVAVPFLMTMADQDMTTAATFLADDVVFEGPLTRFSDAASYLEALGEFSQVVTAVRVQAALGDQDQAMVMYEMETGPFGVLRAMEHFVVRNGKIATDTLVFDTHAVRAG